MTPAQDMLLEEMVKADPGPTFNELLRRHGPILPEETDLLIAKAKTSSQQGRINATRLLRLTRGQDAREVVLRRLAIETDDPNVFALAASGLGDGKTLATQRADLIKKALRASDAEVMSAAVRLAWLADLPGVTDELAKKLDSPDEKVRFAAANVLAEAGSGPFDAKLRAILVDPGQRSRYPLDAIYQALSHSDDPSTAAAFRKSTEGADGDAELSLLNALHSSPSRKPWLRSLLLDLASRDGRLRWKWFDQLAEWGPDAPVAEMVKVCADHLDKFSRTDYRSDPVAKISDQSGVASCVKFLRQLSGRTLDMQEALTFAREWKPAGN